MNESSSGYRKAPDKTISPPSLPSESSSAQVGGPEAPTAASQPVRFLDYAFDCKTGELWSNGQATVLRPQLASLLALLVRRRGDVVARAEIQDLLWGERVLDVDRGINFCIRQLRAALGDDARQPRYIETLSRQGYRFIAPLRPVEENKEGATPDVQTAAVGLAESATPELDRRPPERPRWLMVAVLLVAIALATWAALNRRPSPTWHGSARGEPVPVPAELELELRRAEVQLIQGRFAKSLATVQAAVARHPSHAEAWAGLAEAHI